MSSPAQRRFETVTAAMAAAQSDPGESLAGNTAYELMLAKLDADRRRLKDIQSIERKIEVKREILPEYENWINGVLDAGRGGQDDVLVTVMVWHLDVGSFDEALRIGHYVLQHDLVLPDQYQRNVATVLVDEVADTALAQQKAGKPFPLQVLLEIERLTASHDMHDEARAKLHKALGAALYDRGDLPEARRHYTRAVELNDKIGVKRLLTEIDAALAKASA